MATLFCSYDWLMSVSGTGFTPPVSVDLVPHGLGSSFYEYATVRGSRGQAISMLLCADVSAWGLYLQVVAMRQLLRVAITDGNG